MDKIYLCYVNEELGDEINENGFDMLLSDDYDYHSTFHIIEPENKQHILTALQLANINFEYFCLSKEEYEKYNQ